MRGGGGGEKNKREKNLECDNVPKALNYIHTYVIFIFITH